MDRHGRAHDKSEARRCPLAAVWSPWGSLTSPPQLPPRRSVIRQFGRGARCSGTRSPASAATRSRRLSRAAGPRERGGRRCMRRRWLRL